MNILDTKQSPNSHQLANQTSSSNNNNNNNNNSASGGNNNGGPPSLPPPVSCSSAGPSTPVGTGNGNGGGGGGSGQVQNDCLMSNSQLIPQPPPPSSSSSSSVPPSSQANTGPSSVSSSSAPHTPLDGINIASSVNGNNNGQQQSSNDNGVVVVGGGGSSMQRPTVSTPSSVFNNSAPNTPMPCPSVGSVDANINSPALNQMVEYGGGVVPTTVPGGTVVPVQSSQQQCSPFANNQQQQQTNSANNNNNNNSSSNQNLLSSPLSVHQQQQQSSLCNNNDNNIIINNNNNKNKPLSNGGGNKKHCNNRNQNQNNNNNQNNNVPNNNNYVPTMNNCAGMSCSGGGIGDNKNQMNFSMTPPHHPNNMPCMQNGLPMNGNISPFDLDCGGKMPNFPNEFSPNLSDGCPPPMSNSCPPPPHPPLNRQMSNCSSMMGMNNNLPPMPSPNMSTMKPPCNSMNMPQNVPPPPHQQQQPPPHPPNMKQSSIDGQFMQQHQNQVFVFTTSLANQAAEAIDQGHFPSIIYFHMNHPLTKKFMEKNSIKIQNFNRPNNVWMGSIRQPRIRGPSSNGGGSMMGLRGNFNNASNNPCFAPYNHNPPPGPGPGGGGGGGSPGQWNPNWMGGNPSNNHHMSGFPPNDMKPMNHCGGGGGPNNVGGGPGVGMRQCGPQQQQYQNFNPQAYSMGCNDSMQDDNLTPQQKQHRENKLAILATLHQKFIQHELIETNNQRLPPPQVVNAQSQPPPPPNDFVPMNPMGTPNANHQPMYPDPMAIKQENDHMNQPHPPPPMNPSEMNFQSNFCSQPMMNNHPNNDQWLKSSANPNFPIEDTKPFANGGGGGGGGGGRRKGSQNANHQTPISQTSVNSPNSCINQSSSNRVPPPPYNQGLRSMSSPHPGSPSPRMPNTVDNTRQPNYSVRSGPSTPSADGCVGGGPPLINSPKSSGRSNSSPGNKKNKQQQQQQQQQQPPPPSSIDLNMFGKTEHPLMPVPSPQHIDYINTFEGQELTIQKQPNAHFQETSDLMSNNDLSGLNNDLYPNDFGTMCPSSVNNPMPLMDMNNPNNPSRFTMNSQPCNFDSRYPDNMRFNGNNGGGPPPPPPNMDTYNRPPSHMCGGGNQFNQNDPNMRFPNCDMKPRMSTPTGMGSFPSNTMCDMNFSNSIPPINDGSFTNGPTGGGFNDIPDNPISTTPLQSLQKMAPPFDIGPNSKPMGPNNMMPGNNHQPGSMMGPNPKGVNGPRMQGNYDQPPFGPGVGPMGNMTPCSDMNESNNYGAPPPPPQPPHAAQSNMPMNFPPNNFSNSPQMPSNMIPQGPPNDSQYGGGGGGGMHSGSFSPMSINSHSMMDQNPSNGPSPMPMMPPVSGSGGPVGGGPGGNFPPRLPPNVNRPMNPSNTHGPRYNSPNIQVKPDAPNTIQYLPSRTQGPIATPPNRPPNLDFLQQSLKMNFGNGPPGGPPPQNGPIPPPANCRIYNRWKSIPQE